MKYEVDQHGCWIFTGAKDRDGYGVVTVHGKYWRSNRLAWVMVHGAIPDGMHVCHVCDVPACVNPEHLFLGTHSENMLDGIRKGRIGGEKNGCAKLTVEKVGRIRELHAAGTVSQRAIARQFGVSPRTIRNVVRRELWRAA